MTGRRAGAADARSAPVEAVLLDCLGTLVRMRPPGPRLRVELRRRAGIDVGDRRARAAFEAEIEYYLAHHLEGRDRGSLEGLRDRCAGVIVDALGLDAGKQAAVRDAMLAALHFEPFPDVVPALSELRADGVRLVAASNWDCSLPDVLERAGVGSLLDGAVASAVVGAAKPDPRLVEAALEAAACEPAGAVFVGDSVERDVAAARAAGVRPVLLARAQSARSPGSDAGAPPPAGVSAIRSFDEVRSVI